MISLYFYIYIGKNKIHAINMQVLPIIKYAAGLVRRTKEDMDANVNTRKLPTMHEISHPQI